MRYDFIDAKRGDSLVLPARDTAHIRKRLVLGALALMLLSIAL